ncbi:MAG: hypothetical protein QXR63_00490 [Candidatus Bathyarchaeia archaeon]
MAHLSLDRKLFSLLAEEIVGYLPQFEPYSTDYQMVIYACRDLKEWLKWKLGVENPVEIDLKIAECLEKDPQAFKSLVKCWVSLWVAKWNERVQVLATAPKLPPEIQRRIDSAKNMLKNTEYKKELKQLVMQKLLSQGEVCMVSFIAEQLITEEIAKYSTKPNLANEITEKSLIDIFNSLSMKISRLPREKGPLVYLSIKPNPI